MREERQQDRLPFDGKPLRRVPIPEATVLRDDEFGNAVLAEYHERAQEEFGGNPHLMIFKIVGKIVHGSHPFACCLVDQIVRPDFRVATPVDLQAILDARRKTDELPKLRGYYKDVALALRSIREPNSHLAESLLEQVGVKTDLPLIFHLSGLEVVNDEASPCGLGFKVTDKTHYSTEPILAESSGHFDDKIVDRDAGLPTRLGGSQRYYYGTTDGLTRVYVGRGWSLDTIWDELTNSQADGRIVIVRNDVPTEDMNTYLTALDRATGILGR
ncbi:MAG: hypothetical protein R6V05_01690 [Candidatus Brocadiia bacterium]